MGEELDKEAALAFLRKQAGIGGWLGGAARSAGSSLASTGRSLGGEALEIGKRMASPVKGFAKGWAEHSPARRIAMGSPDVIGSMLKTELAERRLAQGTGSAARKGLDHVRRVFGTGTHHAPGGARPGGIKGVAEALSRHGWTGAGRATKYLPLGDKGQMLVGPAMAINSLRNSAQSDYGPGQGIGEALGFGGMSVLTAGTGMPGMAATMLAGAGSGWLGKKLDDARRNRDVDFRYRGNQLGPMR